jgi:hypothetical protein
LNAHSRMCIHSKSVWLTLNECTLERAFPSAPPKNGMRKKAALQVHTLHSLATHNPTKLP